MAYIFIFSAAIAVLSILNAYFQYRIDKDRDAEKLKASNDLNIAYRKLQDKSDQLQKQSDEIIQSTKEINKLQKDLIVANNKIGSLQEESINQITGGKVDLVVMPTIPIQSPNKIGFYLKNNGKYPVSDISISVTDVTLMMNSRDLYGSDIPKAMLEATTKVPQINSIFSQDVIRDIYLTDFPKGVKSAQYSITVRWRNGGFLYTCVFEKDDNDRIRIKSQEYLGDPAKTKKAMNE